MIKAIIFDFDGVIADTFTITCDIYRIILERFGKKRLTDSELRNIFDTEWRDTLRILELGSKEQIAEAERIYRHEFVKKEVDLFPHVKETLEKLEKYKLAVVSNNNKAAIESFLKKEGILDYFDVVADFTHGIKPNPGALLHAMKILGVKPEETVMVGDMKGDIQTAKNAKIKKCVAVTYGYHTKEQLLGADVFVDDFAEIPSVI